MDPWKGAPNTAAWVEHESPGTREHWGAAASWGPRGLERWAGATDNQICGYQDPKTSGEAAPIYIFWPSVPQAPGSVHFG